MTKVFIYLLLGTLPLIPGSSFAREVKIHAGFASGMRVEKFCQAQADRLAVDSMATKELWNVTYRTPQGLFAGGRSYRVQLKYAVTAKNHSEAGLVFLVRPESVQHGNADLYISIGDQKDMTQLSFEIDVPKGSDDYAFDIHTKHGVRAVIQDFSIIEKEPRFTVFQVSSPDTAQVVKMEQSPEGASEFTVELPVAGNDVSGEQFGLSPENPDNSVAFRNALEACRKMDSPRLTLAAGIYRFSDSSSLEIDGFSDFTLDGNGSTFLFDKLVGDHSRIRQGADAYIKMTNCTRVLIKDLTLDWDWNAAPLASFVRLSARGENRRAVDFENNWLEFELIGHSVFPAEKVRIADIEAVDPATMSVGRSDRHHSALFEYMPGHPSWGSRGKIKWTAPNRVTIFQSRDSGDQNWFFQAAEVGMLYRMRHFAYDTTMLLFDGGNRHITLRDVTIAGAPGMGVLMLNDQSYMDFERFRTTVPDASGRPISCTADNVHSSMSNGNLRFQDCDFGWGGDDLMNLGDANGCAEIVDEDTLVVRNYNVAYLDRDDKVELRRADFSPLTHEFTVRSVDAAQNRLTVVEKLPQEFVGESLVLFPRKYDTRNIIIRNSRFHDNRGHGIVAAARDLTVENNDFEHNAFGGIMLSTGYSIGFWGEGLGVSNAVIRNNRFKKVNPTAADATDKFAMDIAVFLYAIPETNRSFYPLMKQILFEGNHFVDPSGAVLFVKNADAISFVGNTIQVDTPRTVEFPHRGAVVLEDVTRATVSGNVWIASSLNQAKIMISPSTAKEAVIAGNQLR